MHDPLSIRCRAGALSLAALASVGTVFAQTPPDAGALRQQIERQQIPPLPKAAPAKPVLPPALKPPGTGSVQVKAFRFAGNTLLGSEQLQASVAPYAGRTASFAELQAAAAAVAQTYREAGWIVRAYLPQQDVSEGVITIQIVEATFGGAQREGPEPLRLKFELVLKHFDQQQKQGEPLNANALDRALLLADDLPGVAVSGALREGSQAGQTELVLKLADEPLLIGEVGLDNTGLRATGEARATLNATFNSPLRQGDLLSTQLVHTQGSDYLRVGYSLPYGANGLRLGASASTLSYDIISDEFQALKPSGSSVSLGLDATYALVRSRQRNVYLQANIDHKRFQNESNQTVQSDYRVNTLSLGLAANLFDELGGGGANSASLSWVNGRVDQGDPNPGENAALAGGFTKLRASVSRQQVLFGNYTLFGSLALQHAGSALDSSEKFFLGGSSGVRAYPSSEGGGSSGQLATLELRNRLANGLNLTAFYDWGAVDNDDGSPSYALKGAGLAVAWTPAWGGNVRATWARRMGSNPNPTQTGSDQDGSLTQNRFWLSAAVPF